MAASDHFSLHEIAPGIHAAVMRPGGAAVSNAAIIDLGDRTLVVDTFQTVTAAEDLLAAVRELTGRTASVVVNTHWHSDHVTGNQVFADAEILATPRTVELVADTSSRDVAAYTAEIDGYLKFLRERLADDTLSDDERRRLSGSMAVAETAMREAPRWRLTLPTAMSGDRLEVAGSDRTVTVLTFGGGHTESDAFVHIADDRIVITGDLLWVDLHPRTQDGDPGNWAGILDRVAGLGALVFVPGHGPIGGPHHVAALADYLRTVDDLVAAAAADRDADPADRNALPEGSEEWGGPSRMWEGIRLLAARRASD